MSLRDPFLAVLEALSADLVGQASLLRRLLLALLADGHVLLEGPPGLAKTRALSLLGRHVQGGMRRVQFTADLLPADLTGSEVFRPQSGQFEFQPGPLFHALVMADELNRAPPRVQSALLEAMAERQITVAGKSYRLPQPFLVMATQNPFDFEGTYRLSGAQCDRFLFHVPLDYPTAEEEADILRRAREWQYPQKPETIAKISRDTIRQASAALFDLHVAPQLADYMVRLVCSTRRGGRFAEVLDTGLSPRATLGLDRAARAEAWLSGSDHVTPTHIQTVAPDVLRHRLHLSLPARMQGLDSDTLVQQMLQEVSAV